jgi:hypothetical protein
MIEVVLDYISPFYFWIILAIVILIFIKLVSWAKQKKTGALALGIFIQMFTPDPYAERTIKVVQEDKKETKKQQDENGDKPNDDLN